MPGSRSNAGKEGRTQPIIGVPACVSPGEKQWGLERMLWFPDLLCPQALLKYCGELGKGPWVCASPQNVYTSGRQGMAEQGQGQNAVWFQMSAKSTVGLGLAKRKGEPSPGDLCMDIYDEGFSPAPRDP